MRKPGLTGTFWPSPRQELLLRAALLEPPEAIPAWQAARSGLDIDRLEEGSYSLLPLVYRRLHEADFEEPLLPRLKGIYRHTWSKNQLLLQELDTTLAALQRSGVRAAVVGGAARLPYYPEIGLRTMSELELLVPEEQLEAGLRAVGWSGPAGVPPRVLRARSTIRVSIAGARPFGLHWRYLPEYAVPGDAAGEGGVWTALREASASDRKIPVLDPADELLDVLVGGARTALWANVQWVADSTLVIRSELVDWDRFVGQAERHRAAMRAREALSYVTGLLGEAVPADVGARLEAIPATRRDRVALRVGSAGGRVLGELPRTLARYIRATPERSAVATVAGLPRYLGDVWNVDRGWRLPLVAARKGVASLSARSARRRHR